MGLNTTPRTWTTSELVTAALLNTEIRDALTGIQSAWTSYTPTLTGSTTNPTLGTGGTIAGAYQQIGKTIHWRVQILFGTTPSAGSGTYTISLPFTAVATKILCGMAFILDSGTNQFIAAARTETVATGVELQAHGFASRWGSGGNPMVIAVNDVVSISGTYERA